MHPIAELRNRARCLLLCNRIHRLEKVARPEGTISELSPFAPRKALLPWAALISSPNLIRPAYLWGSRCRAVAS